MLGDAMDIGLLLITLYAVRITLLVRNPRYLLTVRIYPIRLPRLLLLVRGLLGFTICATPVILGFQGPYQVNSIFKRNAAKIDIPVIDLLLHCCGYAFLDGLAVNIFFVGHVLGIPGGFMEILVFSGRKREKLGKFKHLAHTFSVLKAYHI